MPHIGLLWDSGKFLDGLICCKDGQVPFSKLILSCHSNMVHQALNDNGEDQVIVLKDFSVSVVRGLLSLLHGSQVNFITNNLIEMEELLDLLGIGLSESFRHLNLLLRARRKRKMSSDEEDVVITFDKKQNKSSNIGSLIRVGVRESPRNLLLKKKESGLSHKKLHGLV